MDRPGLLSSVRTRVVEQALRLVGARRRRILAWRTIWESGVRQVTFERDHLIWQLRSDGDAHIGFGLFVEGGWHRREIDALVDWMSHHRLLEDGRNVVVDVGANVGSTCIPLVRATGCRAIAIEPVGTAFRALRRNVEANGLTGQIRVVNKAVLRSAGRVRLHVTRGTTGGSFVLRETARPDAPATQEFHEEAQAEPLTEVTRSAGVRDEEVALVWADVEGCELDVIESGASLWRLGVPLWAEVNPEALARQHGSLSLPEVAAAHFDRFITSRELVRLGWRARPAPMGRFSSFVRRLSGDRHTDVLFLPPGVPERPPGDLRRPDGTESGGSASDPPSAG